MHSFEILGQASALKRYRSTSFVQQQKTIKKSERKQQSDALVGYQSIHLANRLSLWDQCSLRSDFKAFSYGPLPVFTQKQKELKDLGSITKILALNLTECTWYFSAYYNIREGKSKALAMLLNSLQTPTTLQQQMKTWQTGNNQPQTWICTAQEAKLTAS